VNAADRSPSVQAASMALWDDLDARLLVDLADDALDE
jgi:hypothetical protein